MGGCGLGSRSWAAGDFRRFPARRRAAAPCSCPTPAQATMAALRPLLLALLLCPSLGTGSAAPAFRNQGTPPNISRSYDCSVREHAWTFAKATLPRRGSFRTAFDALTLKED